MEPKPEISLIVLSSIAPRSICPGSILAEKDPGASNNPTLTEPFLMALLLVRIWLIVVPRIVLLHALSRFSVD
ncbi:hypothetical protein [Nostoc sp.]|uniref:hypothetical protein n=1 Tax=Nostoc sp. TaxID=1180 RepID=UPI002FF77473